MNRIKLHVRKGDNVEVISGNFKGSSGKVLEVIARKQRVLIEGVAEDGTIEAIRIADAPSFALGVQWHAETLLEDPAQLGLFAAFVDAAAWRVAGTLAA